MAEHPSTGGALSADPEQLVLSELVSRLLDRGVVVVGDVTLSVAGIDLIHLAVQLRLASTETLMHLAADEPAGGGASARPRPLPRGTP